jgi:hypothetical protein
MNSESVAIISVYPVLPQGGKSYAGKMEDENFNELF